MQTTPSFRPVVLVLLLLLFLLFSQPQDLTTSKNILTMKKTINDIYADWREMKRRLVKESTMATYVINAEKHILPLLGERCELTESDVQNFAFTLIDGGLSARTVKSVLIVLKMIVKHGRRKRWMSYDEWSVRLPNNDAKPNLSVLTVDEQRKIMLHLQRNFNFRNLGIYICLCTGMRIGEICALRWGDISLQRKTITVSRTIERIYIIDSCQRHTKIAIGRPKTASSEREIPISDELARLLAPFVSIACADFYVLSNAPKPLEPRIYRHYYKRLMSRLKMPKLKFHGLRHTFATRCIESQCDYKTVSSILGHANISTTLNLYVHPDINQKRKCIAQMLKAVEANESE